MSEKYKRKSESYLDIDLGLGYYVRELKSLRFWEATVWQRL